MASQPFSTPSHHGAHSQPAPFLTGYEAQVSPTKRERSPSTSVVHNPILSPQKRTRVASPPPASALRELPTPLLLLASAHALHSSALSLRPNLAHAPTHALYCQRLAACATLLRKIIVLDTKEGGGRVDLRARIMLVEVLELCDGRTEADRLIAKGLSAATHDSHAPYKQLLLSQSASLAFPAASKFARSTIKRALPDSPAHWKYHHHLNLASNASDFAAAQSALKDVAKLADERGDEKMSKARNILLGRLALGEGRLNTARDALGPLAEEWFGDTVKKVDGEEAVQATGEPDLPRALKVHFLLAYSLLLVNEGDQKLARERLKTAHQMLDTKNVEEGELEGWCRIRLSGDHPSVAGLVPSPHSVVLRLTPRPQVYAHAFLISTAVHRDSYGGEKGKTPRCIMFGDAGLKSPLLPPASRTHLNILLAELHVLRSNITVAKTHLLSAIAQAATSSESWTIFRSRITLTFGALLVQSHRDEDAKLCFKTLTSLLPSSSPYHYLAHLSLSLLSPSALPPPSTAPESPFVLLGHEILTALARPEITRAKAHLSNALGMANKMGMNHAKALLLSLLANLFLWTRNDQAQKMLTAASHIARGIGFRIGEDGVVGNAALGLWIGEQLLESYKKEGNASKATEQNRLNEMHRRVLAIESRTP